MAGKRKRKSYPPLPEDLEAELVKLETYKRDRTRLWATAEKFQDVVKAEKARIEQVQEIISKRGKRDFGWIRKGDLKQEEKDKINNLERGYWEFTIQKKKELIDPVEFFNIAYKEGVTGGDYYFDDAFVRCLENLERQCAGGGLDSLKAELEKSRKYWDRVSAKNQREAANKEILAKAKGTARELADRVKSNLSKDHDCPYCDCELGDNPHADHIYPLNKGGQARHANMVYVCADCNSAKSGMTLTKFIKKYDLDRDEIEDRLEALGKEY